MASPQQTWTHDYSPESSVRQPIRLLGAMAQSAWKSRELAFRLFMRNLKGSYRQTFFGFVWIIIPTLALIGTWLFLAKQNIVSTEYSTGTSFLSFIAIGSVLWQAFFDSVHAPLRSVLANQGIITKVNFPRESLLVVAIGEVLFDFSVRMGLVLIMCLSLGVSWTPLTFLAPVLLLGLVLIGFSIGLFLTPVGVLYQDVARVLTILSPFWMILSPVVYNPPTVPIYQIWNKINPPAGLLTVTRDLLLVGNSDYWILALVWLGLSIPIFLFGLIWYRIGFPIFIERLAN